ncbi:MAG: hypothetical protein M1822_006127 [Bathelium mastoideum]|nr:MAG: hypothetical protein M1822_006127 [Bathelium mastoideum]
MPRRPLSTATKGHRRLGLRFQRHPAPSPISSWPPAGDTSTKESLARDHAAALPTLRIRFVNIVDLFRLGPHTRHTHGLDCHGPPLADPPADVSGDRMTAAGLRDVFYVTGYTKKRNIDTPLDLAIRARPDRFSLTIATIDRLQDLLGNMGTSTRE